MNDDPAEVDVLYGKVKLLDGSDRSVVIIQCPSLCYNDDNNISHAKS